MDDFLNPSAPAGKSRKYARSEHERRFLLTAIPEGTIVCTARITDHYVLGARLRVRCMVETSDGNSSTVYKLTQKVPAPRGGPGLLTTMYLDPSEYAALAALASRQLCKTRHGIPPFVIDVFDPPLDGLIMAELECDTDEELQASAPPPSAVAEVTKDIRFTGGRLVATSRDELRQALAAYGVQLMRP